MLADFDDKPQKPRKKTDKTRDILLMRRNPAESSSSQIKKVHVCIVRMNNKKR